MWTAKWVDDGKEVLLVKSGYWYWGKKKSWFEVKHSRERSTVEYSSERNWDCKGLIDFHVPDPLVDFATPGVRVTIWGKYH